MTELDEKGIGTYEIAYALISASGTGDETLALDRARVALAKEQGE